MTLNVFRLTDSWLTQCWGARGLSCLSVCHSIASPFNQILGYKEKKSDRSQYPPLIPLSNWDEFLNLVGIKVKKSSAKGSFKTLTVLISHLSCTAFLQLSPQYAWHPLSHFLIRQSYRWLHLTQSEQNLTTPIQILIHFNWKYIYEHTNTHTMFWPSGYFWRGNSKYFNMICYLWRELLALSGSQLFGVCTDRPVRWGARWAGDAGGEEISGWMKRRSGP